MQSLACPGVQIMQGAVVEPLPEESLTLSLETRKTPHGHILFVFNESWSPTKQTLRFTRDGSDLTLWDPWTGKRRILKGNVSVGETVTLELEPTQSLILTVGRSE